MKKFLVLAGVILFAAFLAVIRLLVQTSASVPITASGAAIGCINGSLPLVEHIHPHLSIFVDNAPETIPADIGIAPGCEKYLHTHDASGTIHIETQELRQYTLRDFFTVWGKPVERTGYALQIVAGNAAVTSPDFTLQDNQQIVMRYSRISK